MTDNGLALMNAIIAYRTKRDEIKRSQRINMENKLKPDLIEVGKAVESARAAGYTIDAIASVLGSKNRTFIYEARKAYAESLGEAVEEVETEVEIPDEGPAWDILSGEGVSYHVTIAGYGEWDVLRAAYPDEWFLEDDPKRRKAIREVIQAIEE